MLRRLVIRFYRIAFTMFRPAAGRISVGVEFDFR